MAISKQLMVVAALVVIFIGTTSVEAGGCNYGYKNCDYNNHNGCETNVHKDVKNCGDCHKKCPEYKYTTAYCSGGKCGAKCVDGWRDCNYNLKHDGCEVNIYKDIHNCGSCGYKCKKPKYHGGETVCSHGKCVEKCKKGMKYDNKKKHCVHY